MPIQGKGPDLKGAINLSPSNFDAKKAGEVYKKSCKIRQAEIPAFDSVGTFKNELPAPMCGYSVNPSKRFTLDRRDMERGIQLEATEHPDFDLADIMTQFGFGPVIGFRKARGGRVNQNWIVQTGDAQVVVRCVARERSLNDLRFEHAFINDLSRSGLTYRFPIPLISTSGESVIVKNGIHIWVYEYIEGLTRVSSTRGSIGLIATAMASIHEAAQHLTIPHSKITPLVIEDPWLLGTMRSWQLQLQGSADERIRFFCDHVQECISILEGLDCARYRMLPRIPIHGDWCMANVVFAADELIGIIDFDHCCLDTAIRDITALLQYECVDARAPFKLDISAAQFFIRCYNRVSPLSHEEVTLIPAVAIAESADAFWWKMYEITNNQGGTITLSRIEDLFRTLCWFSSNEQEITSALCEP
jgi:Ser/Thr protein kinase RdoA (MazF antagonist)